MRRDPKKTATDVVDYARHYLGLSFTQMTARNILRRAQLFGRRPAAKPLLLERHRKARMEFAVAHRHWTVADWGRVIWSDETKFNMYNPDGIGWVRRPSGSRYKSRYIKPTVKYDAGSQMAWGKWK